MASHNGPVKKYNLQNGQLVKQLNDKVEELRSLSLSIDGKRLLVANDKQLKIYNAESGDEIQIINPSLSEEINECSFTRSGKQLLITCDDNTITVWDVLKNKKVSVLTGFLSRVTQGSFTLRFSRNRA